MKKKVLAGIKVATYIWMIYYGMWAIITAAIIAKRRKKDRS